MNHSPWLEECIDLFSQFSSNTSLGNWEWDSSSGKNETIIKYAIQKRRKLMLVAKYTHALN